MAELFAGPLPRSSRLVGVPVRLERVCVEVLAQETLLAVVSPETRKRVAQAFVAEVASNRPASRPWRARVVLSEDRSYWL